MKKRILKLELLIGALIMLMLYSSEVVMAAPYNGQEMKLKQPDGSYVEVKVFGDEFYQRVESIDGYTLIRDSETNWICYANTNNDQSDYVSTGVVYDGTSSIDKKKSMGKLGNLKKGIKLNREAILKKSSDMRKKMHDEEMLEEAAKSFASFNDLATQSVSNGGSSTLNVVSDGAVTRSVKGITILIDFPDVNATIPREEIDNMLNQTGYTGYGNNGSVRDYFYEVSGGEFEYTNIVTQYYRAKYNKSYYDSPDSSKVEALLQEALQYIENSGFDFSTVEYLNFMYAGEPDWGWSRGLWPHRGSLSNPFTADGRSFTNYQISKVGSQLEIGTFAHESGHLIFGWKDTYDYGYESKGTGNYCIMSSGASNNPLPPNPYFRNILAGWGSTINLTNIENDSTISLEANSADSYIYRLNNVGDFFIIENISRTGRRTNMGDDGLLIWHIDSLVPDNEHEDMTPSLHYAVSVEQADGLYELERNINGGSAGDAFQAEGKNSFDNFSAPSSKLWSGEESGLCIYDISPKGSEMTFKYKFQKSPVDLREAFIESFEENSFMNGGWTNNGAETYRGVVLPYDGSFVAGFDSGESITRDISTKGYKNIEIKYAASFQSDADADDTLILEWNDGISSTWNTLRIDNGTGGWNYKGIYLPATAENQELIKIRFRAGTLEASEQAYLDAIEVKVVEIDLTPPEAPTNLQYISKTDTAIDLSWTASSDNVGVVGYDLYDGLTKVNTSLITGTSYKVTGLMPNSLHNFTVKARDAAGNVSKPSVDLSVSTTSTIINALLIVDNTTLMTAAEVKVKDRLIGLGYNVTVKSALSAAATDAIGRQLVVMTSTNYSYSINTKFKNVEVPIIVMEPSLYDDMGLTGASLMGTDNGNVYNQTKVTIVNSSHSMTSSLSGTVNVTSTYSTYNWGKAGAQADIIATIYQDTNKAAIFVYDKGDGMVGITAPAKRIGFLLDATTADSLTADGWKLFDAAVNYAIN